MAAVSLRLTYWIVLWLWQWRFLWCRCFVNEGREPIGGCGYCRWFLPFGFGGELGPEVLVVGTFDKSEWQQAFCSPFGHDCDNDGVFCSLGL